MDHRAGMDALEERKKLIAAAGKRDPIPQSFAPEPNTNLVTLRLFLELRLWYSALTASSLVGECRRFGNT